LHVASSRLANVEALALIGHSDGRQGVVEFIIKAIGKESLHPDSAFMIEFLKKAYIVSLGDISKVPIRGTAMPSMMQPSFHTMAPSPASGDNPVRKKVSVGDDPLGMMQPVSPVVQQHQVVQTPSVGGGVPSHFMHASTSNALQSASMAPPTQSHNSDLTFLQPQVYQQTSHLLHQSLPAHSHSSGLNAGISTQGSFTPQVSQLVYPSLQYQGQPQYYSMQQQQQQQNSMQPNIQPWYSSVQPIQQQDTSTIQPQRQFSSLTPSQPLYSSTPPIHQQYLTAPQPQQLQPKFASMQLHEQSQHQQYSPTPNHQSSTNAHSYKNFQYDVATSRHEQHLGYLPTQQQQFQHQNQHQQPGNQHLLNNNLPYPVVPPQVETLLDASTVPLLNNNSNISESQLHGRNAPIRQADSVSSALPSNYKPAPLMKDQGVIDARSNTDPKIIAEQQQVLIGGAPNSANGRKSWLQQAIATNLCSFLIHDVLEHPALQQLHDPISAKVHSIALIKLLTQDPGYGYQFQLFLKDIPAWKKYQSQDHSLLITGHIQRSDYFLTDGGSGSLSNKLLTE
jgi:hypothetical protein